MARFILAVRPSGCFTDRVGFSSSDDGGVNSEADDSDNGGWSDALTFPRIQGADAAGTIVAVGEDVSSSPDLSAR